MMDVVVPWALFFQVAVSGISLVGIPCNGYVGWAPAFGMGLLLLDQTGLTNGVR